MFFLPIIRRYKNHTIDNSAFRGCTSLTSVVLGDRVTTIGDYAFEGCNSLTSVDIPDSITTIGTNAFAGCSSFTDVYYTGSEDDWNSISILGGNIPLHNANIHYDRASQPQFVIGDMNSDGKVTPEDSVILSRHLAKWTGYLTLPVVS